MKTNLIYFTPKSAAEKRAILKLLPAFSYGSLSEIVAHIELQNSVSTQDLKSLLSTNSLICLDFSVDSLFELVQTAVTSALHASIQNTDFGGFCEGSGKRCAIINIGKPVNLDVDTFNKLYNAHPSICLKMWGISAQEVRQKCSLINNFSSLNHVIFDSFGDITLSVESCDHTYLLQELYSAFAPYIYFEQFASMLDCVAELCSVRKREFGVLDMVGGEVINDLMAISQVKPFCVNLANLGVTKTSTIDEIKALLSRRNLAFAVLLAQQKAGFKLIFIDDDIHSFDVSSVDPLFPCEYLKNFTFNKIFNKLKKNTILY